MGGVGKEQVTKGLSKLSMQLTIPCLLFTTALDCSQNWSDDPCPDLWTSLTRGWPMLLLPLLYVFYVGCLLHSVAYEWGVARCATMFCIPLADVLRTQQTPVGTPPRTPSCASLGIPPAGPPVHACSSVALCCKRSTVHLLSVSHR